jgi:hypothetical protein
MYLRTLGLLSILLTACSTGQIDIGEEPSTSSDVDLARIDTDRDGLSDGDELALGTDPRNPDSDQAGRLDGGEIADGLDPLDPADDYPCWSTGGSCWVDADQDGLHDNDERVIGTNPNAIDTDGGGMTDWVEVWFLLDPNAAADDATDLYVDTDGDMMPDAYEPRYGTDPTLADTDGGGLTDGQEAFQYMTDPLDASDDAWAVADDDGDGLLNYIEAMYGTDPNLADTDGGGVNDYTELFVDGSDPKWAGDDGADLYADADGDWVTDVQELRAGTDPNLADTDGGGLTDGEELYQFATDPLDAADDAPYAVDTDGDGLRDVYEGWYGTDPNLADTDGGGVSDYTELYVDGTDPLWSGDDGADTTLDTDGDWIADVYELRNGTDPNLADTDGGGLTDGEELYYFGTNPLDASDDAAYDADADGDGINDMIEGWFGTDPNAADTDGGGVDDYTELYVDHTNPLDGADDAI